MNVILMITININFIIAIMHVLQVIQVFMLIVAII